MIKIETKNAYIAKFESINDVLDIAKKTHIEPSTYDWTWSKNRECNSLEKTYKLLEQGRGLSSVRNIAKRYREEFQNCNMSQILGATKSIKRKRVFNDYDGDVEIDKYLNGDIDFYETIKRNGSQQIVRLGINYSLSCGNNINDFSRMVALASIFAEILESLGYGVEIYACGIEQKRREQKTKKWRNIMFPLKQANEPLDFDRIYSIGLSGLLRDVHFKVTEHLHQTHGGICYEPPQDVLDSSGIDVLLSKSWTENGKQVERIVESIKSIQE